MRNKQVVNLLTILLFAVGVVTAVALAYQQVSNQQIATSSANPFPISKDQAISQALIEVDKEPRRYPDYLPNPDATKKGSARLIHVADNELSFVTDEQSLADKWLYTYEGTPVERFENKYFWEVTVTTSTDLGERSYQYWIDADTGQVLRPLEG